MDKRSLKELIYDQIEFNKMLLDSNSITDNNMFNLLKERQSKLISLFTITCHSCNMSKYKNNYNEQEFITITKNWGYWSNHDHETHTIILCNDCYDQYFINSDFNKLVKIVTDY